MDKNQPIFTLQELQKFWEFFSVPMGLTVSPACWLAQQENTKAQQENIQATHKVEHPLVNNYMSQEGYIKEKSVAKPLKWTSHPLAKDTVLQQISSSPTAKGCCVRRQIHRGMY